MESDEDPAAVPWKDRDVEVATGSGGAITIEGKVLELSWP